MDFPALLTGLAAVLAAVASLVAAFSAQRAHQQSQENAARIQEVHLTINSRLDQLVNETRSAAHAAGVEEGRSNPSLRPSLPGST